MRVLLGVDGSTSSDLAALMVANLVWPIGSTIKVMTAYPGTAALFDMAGMGMAADVIQQSEDAMESEARRMVIHVARRLAAPDLMVETQVVRERAATAVLDQASGFHADLIVLGNRGRGPFESSVLGSVSAEVVDHSDRPVLVARRDRITRILVGEDGSDSAAAASETVRRWPILHGALVRVLSIADVDPQGNPWLLGAALQEAHRAATTRLRDRHEGLARVTAARLQAAGIKADSRVEEGGPAHQLVEGAVSWGADLIVLGTHGRSGLGPLLLGSVARAVLYHAPCSVLIVPGPGRPGRAPADEH
jgi:nucleotide-binding universal stress UspA family protein